MPEQPLRLTRQRQAVAEALENVPDFRSAQEVHEMLRSGGSTIGLATVYRTLQLLADHDQVDVIRSAEGEASYRRCSGSHHHHLVCRSCGATVEVEGPAVERWTRATAEEHGYADVSHTLEIFGVCRRCSDH
ncbi:Fur family transcriptional regulator [Nocardioides coralli]|uniref:Fur family transcriptional regulator n=1 Tax=Nocardioides coralli TaxID=2872154 RepID=UPI001CA43BEB|nr:Fur family transcriptional regulator [Nocardioides coralli]QZY30287.1 transcriptional repressor [Nocardioides coralli]